MIYNVNHLLYSGAARHVKIAITADNHLTTKTKNPERFKTLEYILKRCSELKVKLLIIAGDLFDQNIPYPREFCFTIRTFNFEDDNKSSSRFLILVNRVLFC